MIHTAASYQRSTRRLTAALAFVGAGALLLSCADFGDPFVPPVTTVTVNVAIPVNALIGDEVVLTADVRDAAGRTIQGAQVVWVASDPTVAQVLPEGPTAARLKALAAGMAQVVATSGGVGSAPIEITVRAPNTQSITITSPPSPVTILITQSVQFTARVIDERDSVVANAPVTWNASNTFVSIDANGLLRGVSVGRVAVTATNGGVQSTPVTVNVAAPVLSFATAVQPIFNSFCVRCHGFDGNLTLSGNAYDRIVNVASAENPGLLRVKPGDPNNSYLYLKISGCSSRGCSGDGMPPPPNSPVGSVLVQTVRDWIVGGAPR